MADIVLSSSNRDSFCSSIWSCWAGAPFDLQLVAKVSAHGDLLLNFAFDCLNILIGWDGGSSQWDAPIVLSHSCFHRGRLDKLWANSGDTEAGKGRHSGL